MGLIPVMDSDACVMLKIHLHNICFFLIFQEYKAKQEKVQLVRQELKSHLENLPDLTKLPDLGGGLAPLPSAGDLFASAHRS